jgi:hypothetical protein
VQQHIDICGSAIKLTDQRMQFNMVREAGLEPACLSTGDFKSPEYTISPLAHYLYIKYSRTYLSAYYIKLYIHTALLIIQPFVLNASRFYSSP